MEKTRDFFSSDTAKQIRLTLRSLRVQTNLRLVCYGGIPKLRITDPNAKIFGDMVKHTL